MKKGIEKMKLEPNGLDVIVGGLPRSGTTLVAKLLSIQDEAFVYAGEVGVMPLIYDLFETFPANKKNFKNINRHIEQTLNQSMIEMPFLSVQNKAHPGNLIFDKIDVKNITKTLSELIAEGIHGKSLIENTSRILANLIRSKTDRPIVGEKTPDNIFVFPYLDGKNLPNTKKIVVTREPLGALNSMTQRALGGDKFSSQFDASLFGNLGLYILYAEECVRSINNGAYHVTYEQLATDPSNTLEDLYQYLNISYSERIRNFVINGDDQQLADKAPFYYKRLNTKSPQVKFEENIESIIYYALRYIHQKVFETETCDICCEKQQFCFTAPQSDMVVPLNWGKNIPLSGDHWVDKEANYMVLIHKHFEKKVIHIEIATSLSGEISLNGLEKIQIFYGINCILEFYVKEGYLVKKIEIPLSDVPRDENLKNFAMIKIKANFSFVPLAHLKGSRDIRRMSFKVLRFLIQS